MDTLVEELQQQLTRLPLQQRARCISAVYFVWYIVVIHAPAADFLCRSRFAKAATKATSALADKVTFGKLCQCVEC